MFRYMLAILLPIDIDNVNMFRLLLTILLSIVSINSFVSWLVLAIQ